MANKHGYWKQSDKMWLERRKTVNGYHTLKSRKPYHQMKHVQSQVLENL